VVAATDYVRALPESIGRWLGPRLCTLGTDGFGRSDGRPALRRFFGVDAGSIAYTALVALAAGGGFDKARLAEAAASLGVDRDAPDPETC
jgi:pyruvate dehydrogenase E1 component